MENGFTLCYHLFGGDLQTQTIKLSYQQMVWLKISHFYIYNPESRELKRNISLTLEEEIDVVQEIAINANIAWDKFCFTYNKTSNEKIFSTNGDITAKMNETSKKMYNTDLVIFQVLGMFSLVTISSINADLDKNNQEGDIHNWNTSHWIYDRHYAKTMPSLNVLNPLIMFFPLKQDLNRAYKTCLRLGNGNITGFQNETQWKEIYNFYKKDYADLDYIHFPFEQKENKTILDFYNWLNVTNTFWLNTCQGNFSGGNFFAFNGTNCFAYSVYLKENNYFFCNFSSPPIFTLYGTNSLIDMDKFYYPNFRLKKLTWFSFNGTSIQFDKNKWIGKKQNSPVFVSSETISGTLSIGKHEWKIYNISSAKTDVFDLNLSMHSCQAEEFICRDGYCSPYEQVCDGTFDCTDSSDESNCTFIIHPKDYNQDIIVHTWTKNKVDLFLNLHLIEIQNINIKDGKISLKINVAAKWYDERLKYIYLHKDIHLNVLGLVEFESIWKPKLIYSNTDTNAYYVNVDPEIRIGLNNNQIYKKSVDNVTGAITKLYFGELNPLYWSTVIRYLEYC